MFDVFNSFSSRLKLVYIEISIFIREVLLLDTPSDDFFIFIIHA